MELTNFIETDIVWSFVIGFFTLLFFMGLVFALLFKDQFKETMRSFVENHIVTNFDDEPYKSIYDIEVDAEVLDNVPRHNQED
jgi:hypothetical protein